MQKGKRKERNLCMQHATHVSDSGRHERQMCTSREADVRLPDLEVEVNLQQRLKGRHVVAILLRICSAWQIASANL